MLTLAILGLVLAAAGVAGAALLLFAPDGVNPGGTNTLKVGDFEVATGHVFFAIVIGVGMIIVSSYLSGKRGDVGKIERAENQTPSTSALLESEYTVAEKEVRIDLRNRREIGLLEYFGSDLSRTERMDRLVLKKVTPGMTEVNFRHATSGHSIVLLEPGNLKWRRIQEQSRQIDHPFLEMLTGEKHFEDLLRRSGRLRSYYLTVPLSGENGQEIIYKLAYHNAFQGRSFEWAGVELDADTALLSMHVTFPKAKPFAFAEAFKKTEGQAGKAPIANPDIGMDPGRQWLTWRIRDGKKGETYFMKWKW